MNDNIIKETPTANHHSNANLYTEMGLVLSLFLNIFLKKSFIECFKKNKCLYDNYLPVPLKIENNQLNNSKNGMMAQIIAIRRKIRKNGDKTQQTKFNIIKRYFHIAFKKFLIFFEIKYKLL